MVILCARQFGKCLPWDTPVATPQGPVNIKDLSVGQFVYGYNENGDIELTQVIAKECTGEREVIPMYSGGRFVAASTKEHRWLARWRNGSERVVCTDEFKKGAKFRREFVRYPLGSVKEPYAYALGALIGNGCVGHANKLLLSSFDCRVPNKVAEIIGCQAIKATGKNYTWSITTAKGKSKHSAKILPNHRAWFDMYSREKRLLREVISSWDRESCLSLLAGLIDTDGTVRLQEDGCLRLAYNTASKQLALDVQWLIDRLFQRSPTITTSHRKGSDEFTVFVTSNLHVTRMLKELNDYMVVDHKRWQPEYDHIGTRNHKLDTIGLTYGDPYYEECWDIQVSNSTNLYVLHNEGLITHNSHMITLLAVEDCLRFDDVCILIVAPTLKQCREIVTPRLRRIAKDAPPGLIMPSKSEGKWFIGNSELVMGGMDINSSSQRGKTVQNVYIEEIVDSKPDDYNESLKSDIGPALTHSDGGKLIFATTPPKIPDHPFVTDTMVKARLSGSLFTYTIDDNKMLSKDQYDACVRRSGGRDSVDFRREYLCQIVRDRSIVIIPDFDDSHISPLAEPGLNMNLEVFIDWGGVRDKTAALLMGYEFLTGMDYVIDEMVWDHNTPTELIVKDIRKKWKDHAIGTYYADVPGQLKIDLANSHKFPVVIPIKADWEAAINGMANRFTQRKVLINPRCKMTIETARSGVFNKLRTDFDRSKTLGHMDCIAALMYGIRCLNRLSPYPATTTHRDWQWQRVKSQDTMPITPKTFGTPQKRFV